jgi:hypothetical protein
MLSGVVDLLEAARRTAARSINALMTATYWEIGRRIVEQEQRGRKRARYGEEMIQQLSVDLKLRFGRGFSYPNVNRFRQFYLAYPSEKILSTLSRELTSGQRFKKRSTVSSKSTSVRGALNLSTASNESSTPIRQTLSAEFTLADIARVFPLPMV